MGRGDALWSGRGGLFAEAGHWRWAFWALLPVALFQALLVMAQLRPRTDDAEADALPGIPVLQIGLLAASVPGGGGGRLSPQLPLQALGVAVGLALGALALGWDRRATVRLLPSGGASLGSALGAVCACVALLLAGTTTEIFVPYFLQVLHGQTPLLAGYLTAAMAGLEPGVAAVVRAPRRGAVRLLRGGPVLCVVGLLALAVLIPLAGSWPMRCVPCWWALHWRRWARAWASAGRTC